jgi:hypothetical protein
MALHLYTFCDVALRPLVPAAFLVATCAGVENESSSSSSTSTTLWLGAAGVGGSFLLSLVLLAAYQKEEEERRPWGAKLLTALLHTLSEAPVEVNADLRGCCVPPAGSAAAAAAAQEYALARFLLGGAVQLSMCAGALLLRGSAFHPGSDSSAFLSLSSSAALEKVAFPLLVAGLLLLKLLLHAAVWLPRFGEDGFLRLVARTFGTLLVCARFTLWTALSYAALALGAMEACSAYEAGGASDGEDNKVYFALLVVALALPSLLSLLTCTLRDDPRAPRRSLAQRLGGALLDIKIHGDILVSYAKTERIISLCVPFIHNSQYERGLEFIPNVTRVPNFSLQRLVLAAQKEFEIPSAVV